MDNNNEKLAVCQFLYKKLAEQVSTKDPDNLRGQCDQAVIANYESTGAKSYALRIGDVEVGTYSVVLTQPQCDTDVTEFRISDYDSLGEWMKTPDAVKAMEAFAKSKTYEFASFYFAETGEMPDGAEIAKYTVPGDKARHVKGTTVKVDAAKAMDAIMALPAAEREALLLEAGA